MYALYLPNKYYKNGQELFPIPYVDLSYKKIHFFYRYNFDLLNTASINLGYDLFKNKQETILITPSIGWMYNQANGPIGGFQLSVKYKKWQLYGINQFLYALNDTKLINWYTWSEINYKVHALFRPGASIFARHFTETNTLYFDLGTVFISELNKFSFSIYLMNPWNEKFYSFIGVSYKI